MGRRSCPQSSGSPTIERIENALISKNIELRSRIKAELDRDKDGESTNREKGRRFVYLGTTQVKTDVKPDHRPVCVYHCSQASTGRGP